VLTNLQDVAQGESVENLEAHGFFPKQEGCDEESTVIRQVDRASFIDSKISHTSWCVELEMLLEREKNSLIRNPVPIIASVVITAILALIFGVIFFGVGKVRKILAGMIMYAHVFFNKLFS
jgi:hypothetical protein